MSEIDDDLAKIIELIYVRKIYTNNKAGINYIALTDEFQN